ncbi:Cysteine proteinase 1 [Fragariocoptes setiger]|uniref:Cysteine proteinase 1 n=1 Tax=Fragariocoptes setiger TaxID=1670756 RepID=A0ABQ7S665_9ACAR|nr:Cysteine proteinase 1 [Fragariocoptes setiger]
MAIADLVVNVSYIPYLLHELQELASEKYTYPWALFTLAHAHTTVTAHTISIWLVCVLSTWRFLVVCRTKYSTRAWPVKTAIYAIVGVCIGVPIFCVPNYLSFAIKLENNNGTIEYKVGFSRFAEESEFIQLFHFWIFSIVTKLFPCVLLTYFTTALIKELLRAKKRRLRLTTYGGASIVLSNQVPNVGEHQLHTTTASSVHRLAVANHSSSSNGNNANANANANANKPFIEQTRYRSGSSNPVLETTTCLLRSNGEVSHTIALARASTGNIQQPTHESMLIASKDPHQLDRDQDRRVRAACKSLMTTTDDTTTQQKCQQQQQQQQQISELNLHKACNRKRANKNVILPTQQQQQQLDMTNDNHSTIQQQQQYLNGCSNNDCRMSSFDEEAKDYDMLVCCDANTNETSAIPKSTLLPLPPTSTAAEAAAATTKDDTTTNKCCVSSNDENKQQPVYTSHNSVTGFQLITASEPLTNNSTSHIDLSSIGEHASHASNGATNDATSDATSSNTHSFTSDTHRAPTIDCCGTKEARAPVHNSGNNNNNNLCSFKLDHCHARSIACVAIKGNNNNNKNGQMEGSITMQAPSVEHHRDSQVMTMSMSRTFGGSGGGGGGPGTGVANSRAASVAVNRMTAQNETTTRLLIAVMIVFLICEFPAGLLAAGCAIFGPEFFENVYQPIGHLTDLLALINSSVNFILYCIMSTQFRATFLNVVFRCPQPKSAMQGPIAHLITMSSSVIQVLALVVVCFSVCLSTASFTNNTTSSAIEQHRVLASVVLGSGGGKEDQAAIDSFKQFVQKYARNYANQRASAEYRQRFEQFKQNLALINRLNEKHAKPVFGINEFADRTHDEMFKSKLGYKRRDSNASAIVRDYSVPFGSVLNELEHLYGKSLEELSAEAPVEFDWRQYPGVVTSIKDQGDCGACVYFAVVANLESLHALHRDHYNLDLSEQYLIKCQRLYNDWCAGAEPQAVLNEVVRMGGVVSEQDFRDFANQQHVPVTKCPGIIGDLHGFDQYTVLPPFNDDLMKVWLWKHGPFIASLSAVSGGMQFQLHDRVIFQGPCDPSKVDHEVLVVGYGVDTSDPDHDGVPYWIIKNSWGSNVGDSGFQYIERGTNALCIEEEPITGLLAKMRFLDFE